MRGPAGRDPPGHRAGHRGGRRGRAGVRGHLGADHAGHPRAFPGRAAEDRGERAHAGPGVQRPGAAHRRGPGPGRGPGGGRQRPADQPHRARVPAGLHPDRDLGDRRDEHPDPRAEAADLLRQRPAAQRAGRPDRPPGQDPRHGNPVRRGVRGHGRQARRGPLLLQLLRGDRRAGQRGPVPVPGRRPLHRAADHPAHGPDPGRAPGLQPGHARAGDHDRHDQLLRGSAGDLHHPRRDPLPQGLPRLPVLGPGRAVRAVRHAQGLQGLHHPDAHPDHAQRRHLPPHPRPDRLHHRGADRLRAGDARPRASTRRWPGCPRCRA